MKSMKLFVISFFLLDLFIMCGKKNPTNSEDRPPACNISGMWDIIVTVTGGNHLPIGTTFKEILILKQSEGGNVTGSIGREAEFLGSVTGHVSDIKFDFKIIEYSSCKGTFNGSGTITENCTKLNGNYSGSDCDGTIKVDFSSIEYIPADTVTDHTGTLNDIDGNIYKTVKIGDQWWMAENLKVTHYQNGDQIPNIVNNSEWSNLTTGARCVYDNDESNVSIYGYLYNWYAINDNRGIAPARWHVPRQMEWVYLINYLGGVDVASYKMRETGLSHWDCKFSPSSNESGFTALPGGFCQANTNVNPMIYDYMGYSAFFWSSTASTESCAYSWVLTCSYSQAPTEYDVTVWDILRKDGCSVRLVSY